MQYQALRSTSIRLVTPSSWQPDANACRLTGAATRPLEGVIARCGRLTLPATRRRRVKKLIAKSACFYEFFSGLLLKIGENTGLFRQLSKPPRMGPLITPNLSNLSPPEPLGWSLSDQAQNQFVHRSQGSTEQVSNRIDVRPKSIAKLRKLINSTASPSFTQSHLRLGDGVAWVHCHCGWHLTLELPPL